MFADAVHPAYTLWWDAVNLRVAIEGIAGIVTTLAGMTEGHVGGTPGFPPAPADDGWLVAYA